MPAMILAAASLLVAVSPVSARQTVTATAVPLVADAQEEWIDPVVTGGTKPDMESKELEDKTDRSRECGDRD